MSAHKSIDKICVVITALMLLFTGLYCSGLLSGNETKAHALGYENRLFDRSKVHTLEIVMNDWDGFLATCESETYTPCTVIIDGDAVKNVGIRGKGNTSLSSVRNSGSSRYSFKIEFDQYEKGKNYHGLDKLCLNNIIQDNTYMKDYLAYSLMYDFGADAPLCSYVYLTVNGEDWGLYLAVEAIEDSFLSRNYGSNSGELYKPDAMSFGGGRGNGKDFSMSDFLNQNSDNEDADAKTDTDKTEQRKDRRNGGNLQGGFAPSQFGGGNFDPSQFGNTDPSEMFGGEGKMPDFGGAQGGKGGFGMGSDDVKLKYTGDEISSYSNIFNNAKTDVSTADQKRLIAALKALSEQTDQEQTLDTDEVLRYFVVHNFLCNGDSYTGQMIHNYYLHEKDGQLSMIPWDYNLAYGSFMGGNASSSVNAAIDTPVSGDMSDRPMVAWIYDNAQYTEQYHQLFRDFLSSVDFEKLITETAALIDSYVQKDPTKFCTYEDYQKGVAAIKTFCKLRAESVSGQLNGTIPATSDGQKADSSALIDTGDLNISDMGSMGGGFGGGRGGKTSGNDNRSDDANKTGKSSRSGQGTQTGTSERSFRSMSSSNWQTLAEKPDFGGNMPDFGGQMPQDFDPGNLPEGFTPGKMPGGMNPGNLPEGFSGKEQSGQNKNDAGEKPASDGQEKQPASGNQQQAQENRTGNSRPQPGSGFPGMNGSAQTDHTTEYILLGVSALVLLIGLGFALKFKR